MHWTHFRERGMLAGVTAMAVVLLANGVATAAAENLWKPFLIRDGGGNIPETVHGRDISPDPDNFGTSGEFLGDNTSDNPSVTEKASNRGINADVSNSTSKAGYGTSHFDGMHPGDIPYVDWTRQDDGDDYPYLNIWVTDGTNHAVLAPYNEGSSQPSQVKGLRIADLETNVYETDTSDLTWLHPDATYNSTRPHLEDSDGNDLTIGEIVSSVEIGAPSASKFQQDPSTTDIYSGAPRGETGLNIIFGDTSGSFNQEPGYHIDNITTPTPSAVAGGLLLLGGLGLGGRKRRRRAA